MSVNTITLDVANKSLNAIWQRESLISNNIANSDTPNYKAKDVEFESLLSSALDDNELSQNELDNLSAVETTSDGEVDENGNNVDLEEQMVELTRNQLQYNYMSRSVSGQLEMMISAASEGKS